MGNMLSLLLLLLFYNTSYGGKITATGGGIVKPGQDLVLTYHVGKVWDRCRWFLYEHNAEYMYCSFDLNPDTGNGTMHRCNPTNTSSIMEYTGHNSTECTVTVHNVTDEYNCGWATRIDEDMVNTNINITVAQPIKNMSITMDQLIAGKSSKVVCKVNGGRPAPLISLEFTKPRPEIVNSTQQQTPDEEGVYQSEQEAFITPKIEDHGKMVACKAALMDGENKPLYGLSNAPQIKMNVTFPPQPLANQSLSGDQGGNVTISFVFKANPIPTKISWFISIPPEIQNKTSELNTRQEADKGMAENNNTTTVVELTPGHSDDKYDVSQLMDEGDMKYRVEMTILALDFSDHDDSYYLAVSNSLGTQNYYYSLDIEGHGGGGDGEGNSNGPDNGPGFNKKKINLAVLIVVVSLIAVIMLLVIFFIMYKKNKAHNETAPLSQLEGRVQAQ